MLSFLLLLLALISGSQSIVSLRLIGLSVVSLALVGGSIVDLSLVILGLLGLGLLLSKSLVGLGLRKLGELGIVARLGLSNCQRLFE